jgi:hypothetical protein
MAITPSLPFISFRAHLGAAPLKRDKRRGSWYRSADFRAHLSAAPLKQGDYADQFDGSRCIPAVT